MCATTTACIPSRVLGSFWPKLLKQLLSRVVSILLHFAEPRNRLRSQLWRADPVGVVVLGLEDGLPGGVEVEIGLVIDRQERIERLQPQKGGLGAGRSRVTSASASTPSV